MLNTMIIAVLATLAGCIIGLAVGIVQTIPTDRKQSPVRWALLSAVKFILSAYVEIFRGTAHDGAGHGSSSMACPCSPAW